jgi:poly(hydroxyalkanoate) granule-associated protein
MTEVEVNVVEEAEAGGEPKPLVDIARKVLLASIGAVALAQEEVEDFVNRLVERGEIAEKDGRKLIKDVMERRKQKAEETEEEVESELDERVETVLHRLNVPTKKDIDALSQKITILTEKLDALKESQKTP